MALSKPQRLHKPRFKDWLVDVLNKNCSEDAKWVDKENGVARIRWPHKSRSTWKLEHDAKLFSMWAMVSGKHLGWGKENPKSWKCNFRMNLNICKDIHEIKSRRISKGPNACRYFQIFNNAHPNWVTCEQAAGMFGQQHFQYTNSQQATPNTATDMELFNTTQLPIDPYTLPYAPTLPTSCPSLNDFGLTRNNISLPISNYDAAELARLADNVDTLQFDKMINM